MFPLLPPTSAKSQTPLRLSTEYNPEMEALKQKLKVFEAENLRLSNHVKQAEESIKIYRGYLKQLPTRSSSEITQNKKDEGSQTTKSVSYCDCSTKPTSQKETHATTMTDQIIKNNQLIAIETKVLLLEQEKGEFVKVIADMNHQMKVVNETAANREDALKTKILGLENELADRIKEQKTAARDKLSNPSLNNHRGSVASLQLDFNLLKEGVADDLSSLKVYFQSMQQEVVRYILSVATAESKAASHRIQQLMKDKQDREALLSDMNHELRCAKEDLERMTLRVHVAEATTRSHLSTISPTKSPSAVLPRRAVAMLDQCSSPLSPQLDTLHLRHNPHSTANDNTNVTEKLLAAAQELRTLQQVHLAEVQAVKHTAHIKELVRIAREREASIERDRMAIELRNLSEVQSILTFSLTAAEQALADSIPHVVVKLQEGRTRRLRLLDRSISSQMREIEQRSKDICAGNTAHLEAFRQKAEDNTKLAEDMTRQTAEKLASILTQ